ncbi:unnamed protein product [Blepharisma stoltei]|uniref:Uncharacterized protein n=1 Tax=Blepharisma stoltei TaxID=1481888 RepID=A0AAU9IMS7_9CILI|nr:unnamed protein product [Blepharisma stoltei]
MEKIERYDRKSSISIRRERVDTFNEILRNIKSSIGNSTHQNLAIEQLSMCSFFSSQSKHSKALNYAKQAIAELVSSQQKVSEKLLTLAWYMRGIEEDALGKKPVALEVFNRALQLSKNLKNSKNLANMISDAYERILSDLKKEKPVSKQILSNRRGSQTHFRTATDGNIQYHDLFKTNDNKLEASPSQASTMKRGSTFFKTQEAKNSNTDSKNALSPKETQLFSRKSSLKNLVFDLHSNSLKDIVSLLATDSPKKSARGSIFSTSSGTTLANNKKFHKHRNSEVEHTFSELSNMSGGTVQFDELKSFLSNMQFPVFKRSGTAISNISKHDFQSKMHNDDSPISESISKTIESPSTASPNRTHKPIIFSAISACIKIQSLYRMWKEKSVFKLRAKNKSRGLIYKHARKIGKEIYMISIRKTDSKLIFKSWGGSRKQEYEVVVPFTNPNIEDLLNLIEIDEDSGMTIKGVKTILAPNFDRISSMMKVINGVGYTIQFFKDILSNKIIIKAAQSGCEKEYSYIYQLSLNTKQESKLVQFISQEIFPFITIKDEKIVLEYGKVENQENELNNEIINKMKKVKKNKENLVKAHYKLSKPRYELLTGNLIIRGRKVLHRNPYIISIYLHKRNPELFRVEAYPIKQLPIPQPSIWTVSEICEALDFWEPTEIFKQKLNLLHYVDIQGGKVIFTERPIAGPQHKQLVYKTTRVLNNGHSYKLYFYEVLETENWEDFFIEAEPENDGPGVTKYLSVNGDELKKILGLEKKFVDEFEQVADFIIIESSRELSLVTRRIVDCPVIVINLCKDEVVKPKKSENKVVTKGSTTEMSEEEKFEIKRKAVELIQKNYKKHKETEIYKLKKLRALREDISFLLSRSIRIINKIPYMVEFYRTQKVDVLLAIRNMYDDTMYEQEITSEVLIVTNDYKAITKALTFHNNKIAIQRSADDFFHIEPCEEDEVHVNHKAIKNHAKNALKIKLLERTKKIGEYDYHLLVSEDPQGYKVDLRAFAKPRKGAWKFSKIFSADELVQKYGRKDMEDIFKNATIHRQELILTSPKAGQQQQQQQLLEQQEESYEKPKRMKKGFQSEVFRTLSDDCIIITTEKEYRNKPYKIKVGKIDEGTGQLVFDIVSSLPPIVRKQIAIDIAKASEKLEVGIEWIVPMAKYILMRGLEVDDFSIKMNLNLPNFNLNTLVTKIQKWWRGYWTRKHKSRHIYQGLRCITVAKRKLDDRDYLIYAYLQGSKIRIEAHHSRSVLVLHIENNRLAQLGDSITRKQILEKIIIPSLYVEEQGNVYKLCIEEKVKVSQRNNNIRRLETPDPVKPKANFLYPLNHRRTISNTETAFTTHSPTADGDSKRTPRSPLLQNPSMKYPLLLRTGKFEGKKYFIISIYLVGGGVLIEVENTRANRKGYFENKCEIPTDSRVLDSFCCDLAEKVIIEEDEREIKVKIAEKET